MSPVHIRIACFVCGGIVAGFTAAISYAQSGQAITLNGALMAMALGLVGFATKAPGTISKDAANRDAADLVRAAIDDFIQRRMEGLGIAPAAIDASAKQDQVDDEKTSVFNPTSLLCFVAFVAFGSALLHGCTLSARQRTETALSAMAVAVEPASLAAEQGCVYAGELVIAAANPGDESARSRLGEIHARCDSLRGVFDEIKKLHDRAVTAVESGAVESAQAMLAELNHAWGTATELMK